MNNQVFPAVAASLVGVIALCGCDETKKGAAQATSSATSVEASVPSPPSTLPQTEGGRLKPMAIKVLTFCENQDIEALVLMVAESDRDEMTKSLQPGQAGHERLFGEGAWRRKAVDAWNDDVSEIRIKGDEARAKFGEVDGKEAAVVVLRKKDGVWYFAGLENPPLSAFATWGETAK